MTDDYTIDMKHGGHNVVIRSLDEFDRRLFKTNLIIRSAVICEGVTELPKQMFYRCENLRSVTLPQSLKGIGMRAFFKCDSLKSITLPDGLEIIGKGAFMASGLKKIVIPPLVTKIPEEAFAACAKLAEVSLPRGLTKIGSRAFERCALREIRLPCSLLRIDPCAFFGCASLKEVRIPSRVREIGLGAFFDCSSLERITLPKRLTKLNYILDDRCKVKEIELPPRARFPGDLINYWAFPEKITASFYTISSGTYTDSKDEMYFASTFNNCKSLRKAVIDGIETELDGKLDLEEFYFIAINCATDGNEQALAYVADNHTKIMQNLIINSDTAYIEKLLSLIDFSAGEINEALEKAVECESHEVYILLVQLKHERFGTDDTGKRFDL